MQGNKTEADYIEEWSRLTVPNKPYEVEKPTFLTVKKHTEAVVEEEETSVEEKATLTEEEEMPVGEEETSAEEKKTSVEEEETPAEEGDTLAEETISIAAETPAVAVPEKMSPLLQPFAGITSDDLPKDSSASIATEKHG